MLKFTTTHSKPSNQIMQINSDNRKRIRKQTHPNLALISISQAKLKYMNNENCAYKCGLDTLVYIVKPFIKCGDITEMNQISVYYIHVLSFILVKIYVY